MLEWEKELYRTLNKAYQRQRAEELSKILKKALPLTWAISEVASEYSYRLIVTRKISEVVGSFLPESIALSGFSIRPALGHDIILYPSDLGEEHYFSGYNMAKKFAAKFEDRYHGRFKAEIRSWSSIRV